MPPVFGPSSPSSSRLWSRAAGSASGSQPVADRDDARLRALEALLDHEAGRPRPRRVDADRGRAPRPPSLADDHALAGREPVRLDDDAARPLGLRAGVAPRPIARRRTTPIGPSATPAAAATSWQNAFDVSIRAAAADGPKTGIPRPRARRRRRLRAAPRARPRRARRLARGRPRRSRPGRAGRRRRPRTRASRAIASDPGATTTSFTPGSAASFQASACSRPPPPTIEDPRRHDGHRAHRRDNLAPADRPPGPLDRLGPLGPDRQQHDRDARLRLERRHVPPRVLGQVAERSDVVDRLGPALELLVHGRRPGEDGRRRRPGVDAPPVHLVGDAHPDRVDAREDVELVQHDRADAS